MDRSVRGEGERRRGKKVADSKKRGKKGKEEKPICDPEVLSSACRRV